MFYEICYVLFIICFVFLVFMIYKFFAALLLNLRIYTGYLIDEKVDKIILKSAILGELQSYEKWKPGTDRIPIALEKSVAITTDVFLQNSINPREYNIVALVTVCRYSLGLKFCDKGGEKNGKS